MTLTVAICTIGRAAEVRAILGTLGAQTQIPLEIIVVDASDDAVAAANAASAADFASICRCPIHYRRSSPGLTRQRNVALDAASGDVIVYFDDDCLLDPNCLQEIIACFGRHPATVAVTCNMLNGVHRGKLGLYDRYVRIFLLPGPGDGRFKLSCFPSFTHTCSGDRAVECLCGGAMAIRTDTLRLIRFDDHFATYSYMEDDDISRRLMVRGEIWYAGAARFFHNVATSGRVTRVERERQLIANHYYLLRKNWPGATLARRLAFAWSLVGCFGMAVLLRDRDMRIGIRAGIADILRARRHGAAESAATTSVSSK